MGLEIYLESVFTCRDRSITVKIQISVRLWTSCVVHFWGYNFTWKSLEELFVYGSPFKVIVNIKKGNSLNHLSRRQIFFFFLFQFINDVSSDANCLLFRLLAISCYFLYCILQYLKCSASLIVDKPLQVYFHLACKIFSNLI